MWFKSLDGFVAMLGPVEKSKSYSKDIETEAFAQ